MLSVNVIMTPTFVSGPKAQGKNDLTLNHIVTQNNVIPLYRDSLTVTFRPSWESFVLEIRSWATVVFGSTSKQPLSLISTGLTALHSQVILLPRDASAERGDATVSRLSVCLFVRPSVMIRYRVQIGWNSSKIISRPNSLGSMCWLTNN